MDDKLKVFWNLDVLVKMCRSKSDGPSLRIEEDEIVDKIDAYKLEIEEIKTTSEDESYDTSAEMADRNIEIITKKQLQTLKTTLKEKNKELNVLKEEEKNLYESNSLLRDNKSSQEKYIASMQERINEATDYEVIDRYNCLIAETTEKISALVGNLEEQNDSYEKIQQAIVTLSDEILVIEEKIDKKKKLLAETQANLENKENYIDKTKKEKSDKKIAELELKVQKLLNRLEEIRKDPKYIESKIKDIINNKEDIENAQPLFVNLVNTVIKTPYINVAADNTLEEELLKATQARDTFANEIEQKSYNILEASTPEKIRIEFLNERIALWASELDDLKTKVDVIDRDREYNYEAKNQALYSMIETMKKDLHEFERAYREVPEINVGAKASVKAALDEKRIDIIEAEKIVTAFRKDESDDIARATRTIKYECERLHQNIHNAEKEIESIKNRLTSKKSGLIDITSKNKDKDTLKELAQTVIDIKHRRQFPETPIDIVKRLEEELDIDILKDVDMEFINNSSVIIKKDYEEYNNENKNDIKRGVKVVEEAEVEPNIESDEEKINEKMQEAEAELQSLIDSIETQETKKSDNIESNEEESETEEETTSTEESSVEPIIDETTAEDEVVIEEAEEDIPVVEESTPEETSIVEETPEEIESVESTPVVEETETTVEEPIVETPETQEIETPEEQPTETEVTIVNEESPTIEEQPIAVTDTTLVEEPVPVTEEPQAEASEPVSIDQQIDDMIQTAKTEQVEETQPLDIDAMFEDQPVEEPTPVVEEQPTEENKLAIDTIFNVETDQIESDEETSNEEHLAEDFDQYINTLENKEAK